MREREAGLRSALAISWVKVLSVPALSTRRRCLAGVRGSSPRASTKLGTIKNLHSTDSIDTEDSGTRGRSIWVHSRLLDSSVSAGEGGAVGKGRGVQPRRRTPLGRPELS